MNKIASDEHVRTHDLFATTIKDLVKELKDGELSDEDFSTKLAELMGVAGGLSELYGKALASLSLVRTLGSDDPELTEAIDKNIEIIKSGFETTVNNGIDLIIKLFNQHNQRAIVKHPLTGEVVSTGQADEETNTSRWDLN